MKNQEQIKKIQNTLKKTDNNILDFDKNLDFPIKDKLSAILNWSDKSGVVFDTAVVEGIAQNIEKYNGHGTHNQVRAINNIINRFRIDVSYWVY